jgi:hypothetical protein
MGGRRAGDGKTAVMSEGSMGDGLSDEGAVSISSGVSGMSGGEATKETQAGCRQEWALVRLPRQRVQRVHGHPG